MKAQIDKTSNRENEDLVMPDKLSLWQVMHSVLSGFFGVQSDKNRRRDFEKGKPSQFIIIGLILTFLFIIMVWGGVQLLLLIL